ncbi:hypothetical protein D3C80_1043420 [compost metagenome]
MVETPLLVFDVRQHLAHEMRLVNPRKAHADAIGTLVQPKGHRHRHGCLQLAGRANFAKMLEQHIAAQRVTHGIQRGLRAAGAQVVDGFGKVFTGAGMVAAWQQVRFARATTPVQGDAGPTLP